MKKLNQKSRSLCYKGLVLSVATMVVLGTGAGCSSEQKTQVPSNTPAITQSQGVVSHAQATQAQAQSPAQSAQAHANEGEEKVKALFPKLYTQFEEAGRILFESYVVPEQGQMPALEYTKTNWLNMLLYTVTPQKHKNAQTGEWDANLYAFSLEQAVDSMNRYSTQTYGEAEALQALEETFSIQAFTQFQERDEAYQSANLDQYLKEAVPNVFNLFYFKPSKEFLLISSMPMGGARVVRLDDPKRNSWVLRGEKILVPVYTQTAEGKLKINRLMVLAPNDKAYEVNPELRSAYVFEGLMTPEEAGFNPELTQMP